MKQVRIEWQGQVCGVLVGERDQVRLNDDTVLKESEFCWSSPVNGTLFALGLNYANHASEPGFKPPTEPLVLVKVPNTFTGHQQRSVRPDNAEYIRYGAEPVVMIGKTACRVSKAEAMDYIASYIACNDCAIRGYLEDHYRPNLRIKSRGTLTPISPWIVAKEAIPDLRNLALCVWVNDELRQQGTAADLIFSAPLPIAYLNEFMILQPGDMITTDTPKGLFGVVPNDEVITEVEGVGRLVSHIISQQAYEEVLS